MGMTMRTKTTIKVLKETHTKIKVAAAIAGETMDEIISRLIDKELERVGVKKDVSSLEEEK